MLKAQSIAENTGVITDHDRSSPSPGRELSYIDLVHKSDSFNFVESPLDGLLNRDMIKE